MKSEQILEKISCIFFIVFLLPVILNSATLHAQTADSFIIPQTSPLDLLPADQATHTVLNSGNWSDANTWTGGSIPDHLAKIFIPTGKTLIVDGLISTRIKIIRIEGKLQFSTSTNTTLNVETIVQGMSGELEIGTADNPVSQGITCKINIIDEGDLVLMSDQWEKGLVLMGKTVAYGAQKSAWHAVSSNPASGDKYA